ncbi:MAG: hypothetical protein M3O82_08230 [Verrucomicrobiota bacterium]|nr:hypothetical protein [Verrucomicrobiota bacterium]
MKELLDNPRRQFALNILDRNPLTSLDLRKPLANRGNKFDLLRNIMQRHILWQTLKKVLDDLLGAHWGKNAPGTRTIQVSVYEKPCDLQNKIYTAEDLRAAICRIAYFCHGLTKEGRIFKIARYVAMAF